MKFLKFVLPAMIGLSIGAIQQASAQDIFRVLSTPQPIANWTGFYVGGNVGYGWAPDSATATAVPGSSAGLSFTMKGMIAGGQLGINVQYAGPWVVGIETDFQGSWQKFNGRGNLSILNSAVGFAPPGSESVSIEWFGTTRARIGYAAEGALIFATGGVAYANIRTQGVSSTGFLQINSSPVKIGWALGAGVEGMLSRNLTVRGEYLYLDFGATTDRYTA